MVTNPDLKSLMGKLDDLLKSVDLKDVTSESTGFSDLQDGYYLCEVEKSEMKESKTSHNPMVAFTFKVVEDGWGIKDPESEEIEFKQYKGSKNRKIFIYYPFKDEQSVKRFATDMLKFEDDEGESILPKEAFTNSETVLDALDVLEGMQVYIKVSVTENDDGTKSTWNNLISWKRAAALGLPE